MMSVYEARKANDLYASELIGMRVYSAEQQFDSFGANTVVREDSVGNWDDIGEVNDVILGQDGQVKAGILGVGGFLGVGEKAVTVGMEGIKFVNEDGNLGDFFLAVKANKEALTDAPAYERQRAAAMEETETETTAAQMETTAQDPARPMLAAPENEREGYAAATPAQMTTEYLSGARVYTANGEDIGEVNGLLLDDSGKINEAVLDIGGFLGLGEHRIAVTMDELKILRNQAGDYIRVYVSATKEELEAQPEYDG